MEMLRSGSNGDAVLALQKKLMAMGINPGPIDGAFGPKTHDAVKRYQEQKGLQVDGIAGPETFTALGMMEGEEAEATEVAESFDRPDRDHHQAQSSVETKAEEPAPSGMDALREVEKSAEAQAEEKAESADRAMSEAMKGAAEEAEKATPKARTGFAAKIAAMKEARRARKRG